MRDQLIGAGKLDPTPGMGRRSALKGAALLLAIAAMPATAARALAATNGRAALVARLGEIVIPSTKIPGAGIPAVYEFVALAVEHGIAGAPAKLFDLLAAELDALAGGSFLGVAPAVQGALIEQLDKRAFAVAAGPTTAWAMMKTLIIMGYYTSEIGGSQELAYELVPGRYDPDIPTPPGHQAQSNDWFGLSIRKGAMKI